MLVGSSDHVQRCREVQGMGMEGMVGMVGMKGKADSKRIKLSNDITRTSIALLLRIRSRNYFVMLTEHIQADEGLRECIPCTFILSLKKSLKVN